MKIRVPDILVVSRVVGSTLLVIGFLLSGLWIGRELVSHGYPVWTESVSIFAGLLTALSAGGHELIDAIHSLRDQRRR